MFTIINPIDHIQVDMSDIEKPFKLVSILNEQPARYLQLADLEGYKPITAYTESNLKCMDLPWER